MVDGFAACGCWKAGGHRWYDPLAVIWRDEPAAWWIGFHGDYFLDEEAEVTGLVCHDSCIFHARAAGVGDGLPDICRGGRV